MYRIRYPKGYANEARELVEIGASSRARGIFHVDVTCVLRNLCLGLFGFSFVGGCFGCGWPVRAIGITIVLRLNVFVEDSERLIDLFT